MKVMPSVLGQVGQNVADNLFEIGQSAVKGTVGAVADIARESIEQVTTTAGQGQATSSSKPTSEGDRVNDPRKLAEKQRIEEVKSELATYIRRKKELDQKIAEEKSMEDQEVEQKKQVEKQKKDSWVSKIINRSQTSTERGRLQE